MIYRLSDGTLWVHSPINLDGATKEAIDSLGIVKHIVLADPCIPFALHCGLRLFWCTDVQCTRIASRRRLADGEDTRVAPY